MVVFSKTEENNSSFISKVNKRGVSVVFVGADFLPNNAAQRDEFEASHISLQEGLVRFLELDIAKSEDIELVTRLEIVKFPSVVIMKDGEIGQILTGLVSESVITDTINSFV